MSKSIFVVILRYVVPRERIDEVRTAHLDFLDKYYAEGLFLASGRQKPMTGGVILAKAPNRDYLWDILKQDPFYTQGLSEYQIYEFEPNKWAPVLEELIGKPEHIAISTQSRIQRDNSTDDNRV